MTNPSQVGVGAATPTPTAPGTARTAQQPSVCPKGQTDHQACFAPFRYCPVKGCGRTEEPAATPPEVEDHPAFVGTCDLGNCDRMTTVVLLIGDEWLSACRPCAARQIVTEVTDA